MNQSADPAPGAPLAWLAWTETDAGRRRLQIAWTLAGLLLLALTVRRAGWGSSELDGFQAISLRCVLGHADPYTDLGHIRAYPPLFGILFLPFAVFGPTPWGMAAGGALFGVANYLLYTQAVRLWARVVADSPRPPFRLVAALWIALSPLFAVTMLRCETDVFVVFPLALGGYWLFRKNRPAAAGAALAFAASLKVVPVLYGVFLVCIKRWWRAALGMAAAGVVLSVLLPAAVWGVPRTISLYQSWISHVVAPYHSGGAGTFIPRSYRSINQSPTAVLFRLLTPVGAGKSLFKRRRFTVNIASLPPRTVARIAGFVRMGVGLFMLVLWTWMGNSQRLGRRDRVLLFATVPLAMLFLSEVSLTTHHVILLLPFGALLGHAMAPDAAPRERENSRLAGIAWIILLSGAFPLLKGLGSTCWAALVLFYAVLRTLPWPGTGSQSPAAPAAAEN